MKKNHKIKTVSLTEKILTLRVDDKEYSFQLSDISTKLSKANLAEKDQFKILPSGYGIHWPLIDEDLSIDVLLGINHCPYEIKGSVST